MRILSIRSIIRKIGAGLFLAFIALLLLVPASALAAEKSPASTHTVAAGPYVVDVELYEDPPYVDKMTDITVVPHDKTLQLQGKVKVVPGLGTEALPLTFNLSATNDQSSVLRGQFRMPVRGAWDIQVQLNGSKGVGEAAISVVVAAPGAIPTWLGWVIGSSPLVFIAFWIWHQHRYRNKLAIS
jgi:hypothetical protein